MCPRWLSARAQTDSSTHTVRVQALPARFIIAATILASAAHVRVSRCVGRFFKCDHSLCIRTDVLSTIVYVALQKYVVMYARRISYIASDARCDIARDVTPASAGHTKIRTLSYLERQSTAGVQPSNGYLQCGFACRVRLNGPDPRWVRSIPPLIIKP